MNPAEAKKLLRPEYPYPVRVKICGLTNALDTDRAIGAGADALGFNFYPGSRRFLCLETERNWLAQVPDLLLRVGVVVNPTFEEALSLLEEPFLDALQLHGDETPAFCEALLKAQPKPLIKAIRVRGPESLDSIGDYDFLSILLDACATGEYGGTGQTFDWTLLAKAGPNSEIPPPWILSGGLNPENITAALRFTKMRFLDVASGVENNPREKSAVKMNAFVTNARKVGF